MKSFIKTLGLLGLLLLVSSCELEKLGGIYNDFPPSDDGGSESTETSTPLTDDEILAQVLNLPTENFNYANPNLPRHFEAQNTQELDNTPPTNRVTNDGATLGRVLFYDKLSHR